ncbi:MAG: AsmA family protein [Burkholderiales bacterium]
MKYLKIGLYVVIVMVVVFGAVLAYIAATFDPNEYKGQLVDLVHEKTGRNLNIEGDIRLTFFPKIGVGLGPTQLSERDSETEFAGVDDLRVALALLPLLSKQIVVDEVVADGLRAKLVKHADGTTNIDDLAKTGEEKKPQEGQAEEGSPETGESPMKLDVQGVRINNGSFVLRDEQAGATYEISELSLKTGRIAQGVPTQFEYSAVVKANKPQVDLRTRASGTLEADTASQIFKVTGLKSSAEGLAATVSDLKLTVSAADVEAQPAIQRTAVNELALEMSGVMDKDRFAVTGSAPRILLDKTAVTVEQLAADITGVFAGTELTDGKIELPKLAMDLQSQNIDLKGLTIRAAGKQADNTFSATLDAPQLAITPKQASGEAIKAAVQARGPQLQADAKVLLSAVTGSASALNIGELAIDLDAKQGENAVKGRVKTPVSGDLEKQRFRLSRIDGQYDVQSPALPMKRTTIPLSGRVDADLKDQAVKVDLKTRFDESKIDGTFSMRDFAKPFIQFDAAVDKLDLDRYLESGDAKTGEKKAPAGREEKSDSRIDLSGLKELNLDGKLRIGSLVASNVKLSDVRVTVKAKDGKVEINPMLANLYGGSVRSVMQADANTNQFAIKQNLSGITIGPLLQDALDQDMLEGRGSVDLDLTAQGDTVGALMKTLSGEAGVLLKDGAIKGINLAQSLRSAGDMLSLKRDTETAASPTEKTDFSELKASFKIDKGQARNEDLTLSSPFIRLNGAGSLNLVESSIDYVANTSLVATSTGQDGKSADDVAGITVPVRVHGPITALKYELQFSDAIQQQAKQRLKAEETKLKKKLESNLTEQLLGGDSGDAKTEGEAAGSAAPTDKPEDELKKRLKDLFK